LKGDAMKYSNPKFMLLAGAMIALLATAAL
jgi:hypothetical protein